MSADFDGRPRVTVTGLLLGTGPRFARDAIGPVIAFYLCWKLVGLATGVLAATALAIAAYVWERRRARTGLGAGIGLGIALIQAVVALASGSAIGYFAPGVVAGGLYGLAFLVSVVVGRPLAGVFARETYPFPPEIVASLTFRRTFSRISLAWGVVLLARAVFRLVVLSWRNVDVFVVITVLTGIPLTIAMMTWSLWYGVRCFRRSTEWTAMRPHDAMPR